MVNNGMKSAFEVKSARLDALAIQLYTDNLVALDDVLKQHITQYQELNSMPFLLDVQDFDRPERLDIGAVAKLFHAMVYRLLACVIVMSLGHPMPPDIIFLSVH